jgi:aspartyl protease family protein
MTADDTGRFVYLLILGIAIVGWFLAENRASLGKTARLAAAWGLIFLGVIAAFGLWSDIRDDVLPRQSVISQNVVEVPRGSDGHYHLTLFLNDKPVDFIVDTGASDVVLSLEDARRIGLDPDNLIFAGTANTANGTVSTASARIDNLRLGDIRDKGVRISVNGGEMDGSLLGMSYLQRFSRIEIVRDKLILTR